MVIPWPANCTWLVFPPLRCSNPLASSHRSICLRVTCPGIAILRWLPGSTFRTTARWPDSRRGSSMRRMRCLWGLAAVLVGLIMVGPGALAATFECWTDGLYNAESDDIAIAAQYEMVALDGTPTPI